MNFVEILGLFVCFCGIQAALDLGKDYARAKLAQRKINQTIDLAVGTVWRSVLKYQIAKDNSKRAAVAYREWSEKEEGEDDEMSDLR